eukprot:15010273-Heterocapsa_arctica.AAC.1
MLTGGYQTKEFTGPPSLDEWMKSWRVFATAMMILKGATRARLERYANKIASLDSTYPNTWWLIALADGRMRGEHFERLRRKAQKEHEELLASGRTSTFRDDMPWDSVFKLAVTDETFWFETVDEKALLFAT